MDIVKKNLTSIISGIIAILAIVAAFYPTEGYFDDLRTAITKRSTQFDRLKGLAQQTRFMPILSLQGTKAETLKVFPNDATIKKASAAQDQIAQQANDVLDRAARLNQGAHTLLTAGSLPTPGVAEPFKFQQQSVTEYARLRDKVLMACQPPASDVIESAKKDLTEAQKQKYQYLSDGKIANQEAIDVETAALAALLPDQLRQQAAQMHQIYLDKDVLQVPGGRSDGPPNAERIWACQHALWISQDVCQAIAVMNSAQKGIPQNPVKHLLRLGGFEGIDLAESNTGGSRMSGSGMYRPPMPAGAGNPTGAEAPRVGGDWSVALPKSPWSPTLRAANGLYDVITFHLTVRVDADKIEPFLQTLEAGQLICVRNVDEMKRVDTAAVAKGNGSGAPGAFGMMAGNDTGGYVYGPRPVAQLELTCEELFMRSWTNQWMPTTLKDRAGQPGGRP